MIKDQNETWTRFFVELAILIVIVLCIRFYVFQFFRVSGPSMCPTLNFLNNECEFGKGEFVFVDQFSYHFESPKRGEVVVFRPPTKKTYYIKRVIGVPGDTVEIRQGKIYLTNDTLANYPLPEPYLSERNAGMTQTYGVQKFEVPEGKYFLVGDNRAHSLDGRQCFSALACSGDNIENAFVEASGIKGVARFVVWPFWTARQVVNELEEESEEN
jgi:signal peptidase I